MTRSLTMPEPSGAAWCRGDFVVFLFVVAIGLKEAKGPIVVHLGPMTINPAFWVK